MSLDHLNEEGPAEFEEIEIPFSIVFLLSILLTISHGIHFNGHFYIFGLIARILLRTYEIWTIIQDVLFYWYYILCFNYDIKQKERSSDSTQSRDRLMDLEAYQQILPELPAPITEIIIDIRPQIHFQQNSHIDEIPNTSTFTGNITYISQNIVKLLVYANIPCIYDPPKVQQDKQLEEFLRGEIHCQNFINQDLTFLQPSVIHTSQPKEDSTLPERNTIAVPPIETLENNPPQEQDTNFQQASPAEALYDRSRSSNTTAPIQLVEPIIGLTPEEQCKKEEDPNLTLIELLGLTPCKGHITTPLQTLDGLYVNQLSRFLPLAQEVKKLAKKLNKEEEASQWSWIPIRKVPNESFTEQLNYIQVLQQIAPLHSTRENLPQDIIRILESLGKVETTPFDKLYYLAQNCTDRYYTKVIQIFVKLIKRNMVNTARALKYLEAYGQRQSQLFTVLEKYHQVPNSLEDLKSLFHFLKEATSRNIENLQQVLILQ